MNSREESSSPAELLARDKRAAGPDLFDDLASPVIRAAARRVASAATRAGETDPALELRAVARCLETTDPAVLESLQHFEPGFCLHCLDRLRAEVIHGWSADQSHVSAQDLLTLVEGFDRARIRLVA